MLSTLRTPFVQVINKLGRPRTALILAVLEIAVLGIVNGLDFPLSVPYQHRVTGQGYLDFCNYCSATAVQSQVDALGVQGRLSQALLLSTIDIVIPTLSCLFGIAALAALTRQWRARGSSIGWLLAVPVAAMLLDFGENWSIVGLLIRYPAPSPILAGLEGLLSGLKVTAYGLVAVSIVVLLVVNAVFRRHTVEVQQ
jgi:hypothetical protein